MSNKSKLTLSKMSKTQQRNALKGRLAGIKKNLEYAVEATQLMGCTDLGRVQTALRNINKILEQWDSHYIANRYGKA